MPYVDDAEYRELKREASNRRFNCPRCGADHTHTDVIGRPDFRCSNSGEYTVKCLNCGHVFGVADMCSG